MLLTAESMVEILLAKDNPNDLELTVHPIKRNNLTNIVHIEGDGAIALEFIFSTGEYAHPSIENCLEVILLDRNLPLGDGLDVLRRIKAGPGTQSAPVVMLTSSSRERLVESYQLSVNRYITKPVDFEQFPEAVRHLGVVLGAAQSAPTDVKEMCS